MTRFVKKCFATRRRAVLSILVLLSLTGATAFCAWHIATSGTGPAKGTTGNASVAVITVTAPGVADPDPGCVAGANCQLQVDVSTGGAAGYNAVSAAVLTPFTFSTSNEAGCPGSNFSLTAAYLPYGTTVNLSPPVLLAATGTTRVTIPAIVHLDDAAPLTCQNVSFTLASNDGGGLKINAS